MEEIKEMVKTITGKLYQANLEKLFHEIMVERNEGNSGS